jgi:hypothetical protein
MNIYAIPVGKFDEDIIRELIEKYNPQKPIEDPEIVERIFEGLWKLPDYREKIHTIITDAALYCRIKIGKPTMSSFENGDLIDSDIPHFSEDEILQAEKNVDRFEALVSNILNR